MPTVCILRVSVSLWFILALAFPLTVNAQENGNGQKEAVVLMPVRIGNGISREYKQAYETAVKQSLSAKWKVYSGPAVEEKVAKIYQKRSAEAKEGQECDETKCKMDIAIAFQTEIIAVASVVKSESGYMLSLSVVNVMDDADVYSNSVPCRNCDELAIVDQLKTLYAEAPPAGANSFAPGGRGATQIAPAVGEMVAIAGDCFEMGSNNGSGDEKPVHRVCVDDFFMDRYEVTQAAYEKVMGTNPSNFTGCPTCPVEKVDWNMANTYCAKVGKRLPTEAQWEYSARSGGKNEKYAGTSDENVVGDYAWFGDNSGRKTHPVGQKKPNGLGLYDMSGNVWEWVSDWYDKSYYGQSGERNPTGPSSGSSKVFRGGSWFTYADSLRAAYRYYGTPDSRLILLGFRCSQY